MMEITTNLSLQGASVQERSFGSRGRTLWLVDLELILFMDGLEGNPGASERKVIIELLCAVLYFYMLLSVSISCGRMFFKSNGGVDRNVTQHYRE